MRKIALLILLICTAAIASVPFAPVSPTANAPHTCTSPSSRLPVAAPITGQMQLELQNGSTTGTIIYWAWGDSSITASASSYPVYAGHSKLVTVNASVTHVACFAASGSHLGHHTVGVGDS